MTSDGAAVTTRVVEHVGWIKFDRSPVNAFDWSMVREVTAAIGTMVEDPDVRVLVLGSANPGYFSAGADLETFRTIDKTGMSEWCELVHGIVHRLRSSPKPTLAAIDGVAVGGGLEMALHCDVRFATHDARLGQPEVNINFIPPVGATQALARLLGRPAALRFLYDGGLINAEQALTIGLVDELVSGEELEATVQRYGESLCAKPPEALAAIRQAITVGGAMAFDDGLAMEAALAIELAGTANFAEGVAAFLAKRSPEWRR
ncbi:MAG: enoyl-CoA hydratase/isomerase family protein [Ilumatobacter sp.]|jgi:enoyl-CoA hydratase|uniref:enoyl-CoA hydratase/isomerase family protein n=1 Tax=Ilumatobacter sp. TaxID=1967498 RepID=UPI001D61AA01|nr:enoyl-CoA hydratase/isomerase family protein [Ilumatobacter sp.]MBT5276381.1 enoyl-CoA hydratase/isomerase family protein [Ilumatobacter sp.]MBT5553836.1 enoyl-CoA hydratase/isomerase family protein [Ilumatobacter sp.]MBT5865290.1 enoyl-CoA hydratase/isomerase family protein [Ilumatobacter sp.]MDG0975798.1 enoyl-CoA hydratase/isomerase family protein [Ilumatobacter sp.]